MTKQDTINAVVIALEVQRNTHRAYAMRAAQDLDGHGPDETLNAMQAYLYGSMKYAQTAADDLNDLIEKIKAL